MTSRIPESWCESTLGQLNQFSSRSINPAQYPNEVFELYSVPSFPTGEPELLKGKEIGSSKQLVQPNDVLVCKINPRINRVWHVREKSRERQIASSEWIGVRSPSFDSRYLRYFFSSSDFRELICTDLTGVGGSLTRAQPKRVITFPVPVAPSDEQKRIADKLDAVLARVDACRERLDRVPDILKRFRQSVLAAATSGKLTEEWRQDHLVRNMNLVIDGLPDLEKARRGVIAVINGGGNSAIEWEYPESWAMASSAQLLMKGVFVDVKDGNHGSNHPKVSDFTRSGLSFITAAQVNDFRVDYDGAYKISGAPLSKLRVGFAKAGDVVLTHKGSVGRVACIDRDCVLTPQTTYYRVNTKYVLAPYLMYFMASQPFSMQLNEIKSQTTRDFVPISQQYGLWHLLPPIEEQGEIVRRVEALFAYVDRIESCCTTARAQVERLAPALLAKAFRGELVPQDPNDEPASVLLERVRGGRPKGGESTSKVKLRISKSKGVTKRKVANE